MTRWFPIVFAAGALAACGGAGSTQDFRANAPTFDKLAVAQNDGDMVEPSLTAPSDTTAQDATTADCHPHLFVRTHEIVARLSTVRYWIAFSIRQSKRGYQSTHLRAR